MLMNHDATWNYNAYIESDSKVANKTVLMIVENMLRIGWSEAELFGIHMALEEAIVNAIKHGNGLDPEKKVHVVVNSSLQEFYLKVTDEGPGFDPDDVPDPTTEENLEMGSGRGLMLMRHYMDHVMYNDSGNSIEVSKRRSESE